MALGTGTSFFPKVFTESPDWGNLDQSLFVCPTHPDSSRRGYF